MTRFLVITSKDGAIQDVIAQDGENGVMSRFLKGCITSSIRAGKDVAIYRGIPEDNFSLLPLTVQF